MKKNKSGAKKNLLFTKLIPHYSKPKKTKLKKLNKTQPTRKCGITKLQPNTILDQKEPYNPFSTLKLQTF